MEDVNPLPEKGTKESLSCDECGRVCFSKAVLVNHERGHGAIPAYHYDIQNDFSCSLCNKVCRSASGLTRHYRSKHPDHQAAAGKRTCNNCGMPCKSLAGLMSHLRTSPATAKPTIMFVRRFGVSGVVLLGHELTSTVYIYIYIYIHMRFGDKTY